MYVYRYTKSTQIAQRIALTQTLVISMKIQII